MRIATRIRSALVIGLLSYGSSAHAQEIVAARIAGTVTDETGGTLPGVTITLTSPALQLPQLTQVTDGQGQYQFLDLRPGTYRLGYELSGFSSLVREGIILTTGFVARVDVALKVGSVAETITVSGASPIIDVVNTRGGAIVSEQVIQAIPSQKVMADVVHLAGASVQYRGAPLHGEAGERVTLQESSGTVTFGQVASTSVGVEGLRSPVNEAMDWNVAEEVDVKSFGNGAEQDSPGARIGMIVKSGGNSFHGNYRFNGQDDRFAADNIDDALRQQGLTSADAVTWFVDLTADLGGRIIKDQLWFYGAVRHAANDRLVAGMSQGRGPDGVFGTPDDPPGRAPAHTRNQTIKLSYQPVAQHKFIGFFMRDNMIDETEDQGSRYVPFESTAIFQEIGKKGKIEWQSVFGSRLLASVLVGKTGYKAFRHVQPEAYERPSEFDVVTQEFRGARFTNTLGWRIPNSYPQMSGGVTFLPSGSFGGSHKLQLGGRMEWREFVSHFTPSPAGDYQMRFNTIAGVPHQPFQLVTVNRPVIGNSRQNAFTIYATDEWRLHQRVTVNAGIRWEGHDSWVPPQSREAGTFSPAANFDRIDVGSWRNVSPRVGAAYDIFGSGKTVVKATYGRYYQVIDVSFANEQNKNTITTTTFLWRDRNGDGVYQPGEVNLDLNGPDFVSISGGNVNTPPSADLKMPFTDEVSLSVERELFGGMSIRGLYVYKKAQDQFSNVNVLRPRSVWNRQFTRVNPGPDGIRNTPDDRGTITIYDYDPAYRGAAFVQNRNVNRPGGRNDSWDNFEVTLRKRGGGKWLPVTVSMLATKNHRWLSGVPTSPNDDLFPLDETWAYTAKVVGGYELAYGVTLAADFSAYDGVPGQETYLFNREEFPGGPAFPSSTGGMTLRTAEFGAVSGPNRFMTNLRTSKTLTITRASRLKIDFDVYNLFNTNVPWSSGASPSISFAYGPTYGNIERVMTPRVARLGLAYSF